MNKRRTFVQIHAVEQMKGTCRCALKLRVCKFAEVIASFLLFRISSSLSEGVYCIPIKNNHISYVSLKTITTALSIFANNRIDNEKSQKMRS